MSNRPFMQLYVSDFLGDTLSLSAEQVGAYMLLLMAMWNAGGTLPKDDKKLARITRLSVKKWQSASIDLMPYFDCDDESIWHNRLTKEIKKSASKSELRRSAGERGGRAKALKTNNADVANASVLPKHLPDTITIKKSSSCNEGVGDGKIPAIDIDELQRKLTEACDGKIQPHGAIVLEPIFSMMAAGADLETMILPTVRVVASRLKRPAGSWSYFVPAIQDAMQSRSAAIAAAPSFQGDGRTMLDEAGNRIPTTEARWKGRLETAAKTGQWPENEWGPAPGMAGCTVPKKLLEGWKMCERVA